MATWECRECTTAYAPGAPACPQCGTNDPVKEAEQLEKEREQMAKITVHGGPSNADAEPGHVPDEGVGAETLEVTEEEATEVGELPEVVDYNGFTVEDLRAELKERKLPTSGTKPELVERLAEDDGNKLMAGGSTVVQAGVATGSGDASAAS